MEGEWKIGDWCIFDLNIVQITRLEDWDEVSDGSFCTSGRLKDRFRPLTLRNKRTIEWFDYYYKSLYKINGEAGFNYPRISDHFNWLSREAMDGPEDNKKPYDSAMEFIRQAEDYVSVIQGIPLFRPKVGI